MSFRLALPLGLALAWSTSSVAAPPTIADFAARDDFDVSQIKLSPTGEYVAVTMPHGDRTGLVTLRVSDLSRVGAIAAGSNTHITDIDWIGPDRLIYAMGEKFGELERPYATGELMGVDVDGGNHAALVGLRAGDGSPGAGSRIQRRKSEAIFATYIGPVKAEPGEVFVSTFKFGDADSRYTQVDRLDVRNGRRIKVASVPVTYATFLLDHAQHVRFAHGSDVNNDAKLYYRENDDAEWVLINDQAASKRILWPIGFSADDGVAYLMATEADGPHSIQAMDPATRAMRELARDSVSDPYAVLYSPFDGSPFGVMVAPGKPKALYFGTDERATKLHRSLQASFPDQSVYLGRATQDGKSALFTVFGERNSGEAYRFDFTTNKAAFLAAAAARIDPQALGKVQPVSFDARDGTRLHGYLTLPPGSDGKNLPLVVVPHGGPFGIFDAWQYDAEAQVLASRGYAVLQPNFRGSGGYGNKFEHAGYGQWGRLMQDDVTDATLWAVKEGIADGARICIHGSSYGAYAALMGVVREPDLYRCASGNVGLYDLRAQHRVSDTAQAAWGRNYLRNVMDMDRLAEDSPVTHAAKIRVPVLLSAGDKDERTPRVHTESMHTALVKAGVPVEMKIYENEGHGYYEAANREDYYNRLVAFLDKHIGTAAAPAN